MKKEDRRVKKTEKALAEALSKLLVDKKIQNITIRELTETADLHRSTFYTHYTDIYDLYEKLENSFSKTWMKSFPTIRHIATRIYTLN